LSKCKFGATNVKYLGFRLTPEGILPWIDKLKAVRDSKPPRTVQEIQQSDNPWAYVIFSDPTFGISQQSVPH
jgi:hypothetical protein